MSYTGQKPNPVLIKIKEGTTQKENGERLLTVSTQKCNAQRKTHDYKRVTVQSWIVKGMAQIHLSIECIYPTKSQSFHDKIELNEQQAYELAVSICPKLKERTAI